jgi:hypothetical protein
LDGDYSSMTLENIKFYDLDWEAVDSVGGESGKVDVYEAWSSMLSCDGVASG